MQGYSVQPERKGQTRKDAHTGILREQLLRFDRDVIRKAFPSTPENNRLLRPALLEALLECQPTSKGEFLERIPPSLRQATSAEEGKYLAQVLEIIDRASEEIIEMQEQKESSYATAPRQSQYQSSLYP